LAEKGKATGRPKSDNPRRNPITVRLTDEELSMLKKYAEKHSVTMTQVILGGIRKCCSE
jgi:hypothetical protein